MAAYGLTCVGLLYVIMWSLFPQVLLLPVMVTAGVLYAALCFARIMVVLDQPGGEVAITTSFWTRHVRLTQIERVEVRPFGAKLKIAGGEAYEFGRNWKGRWPGRWIRVRSGFEEMESVLPRAAADARAADPGRAAAEDADSRRAASRREVPVACFASGVGLFLLAAGAVVQPQTAAWPVHALAQLLRIYCFVVGGLTVLTGIGLLCSAWRDRRKARNRG
jgi:hypothetical protein